MMTSSDLESGCEDESGGWPRSQSPVGVERPVVVSDEVEVGVGVVR